MVTRRAILASTITLALPVGVDAKRKKKGAKKSKPKDQASPILFDLAAHQWHSYRDDTVPIATLVQQYRAGDTLYCSCGTISRVAVQVLAESSIRARVVGAITQQAWNGVDDGHIMVEVQQGDRWRLYDLDGNRRAPGGIAQQVAAGSGRQWEAIASDPITEPGFVSPMPEDWPASFSRAWDDRAFGTAWITLATGGFGFHDASDRARLETAGYFYVSGKSWRKLTGTR